MKKKEVYRGEMMMTPNGMIIKEKNMKKAKIKRMPMYKRGGK